MSSSVITNYVLFTGLLYFLYKIAFQQMKFFQWNRVLLLSIPIISLLIATIAPKFQSPPALLNITLPQINITEETIPQPSTALGFNILNFVYFTGVLFMSLSAVAGFIRIFRILKSAQPSYFEHIPYSVSDKVHNPFTFFTSIILPSSTPENENLKVLLIHEEEHRKQRHTLDNIYFSLVNVIGWFNPFTHLLAKELRMVHEAQADAHSLTQASQEEYARMLLSRTFGSPGLINRTVSPFFNSSFIKNRITMLYKKDNPKWMRISYALFLPLLAGMILFACNKVEDQTTNDKQSFQKEAIAFSQADNPPLFDNCDADADIDAQKLCFQQGILAYVGNNFKYPESAEKLGIEGKVYVGFTVNEKGVVINPEILRGLLPETADNKAAIDEAHSYIKALVLKMPKMKPAIVNGKNVAVTFTLPISMKLEE